MTYPTAYLERDNPKTKVTIKDCQIIGGKYMCQVEGAFNGWIKFWFLNFDEPTSFQDVINDIQAAEAHEYSIELQEMRMG